MNLQPIEPAVAPQAAAGILLAASSLASGFGLTGPTAAEITQATGVGRSRAYELRRGVLEAAQELLRPVGRPRAEPPPEHAVLPARLAIVEAIFDFVVEHPGCTQRGERQRFYSDEFRRFLIDLRERHADVDLRTFSKAARVPLGTLESWIRPGSGLLPSAHPVDDGGTEDADDGLVDEHASANGLLEAETAGIADEHAPHDSAADPSPPDDAAGLVVEDPLKAAIESDQDSASSPKSSANTLARADLARIQSVIAAYRVWSGTFTGFCASVQRDLKIPFGITSIASILFETGERTPMRRRGRRRDEEATRGSFELFFPDAQWVADGKEIVVYVDGQEYRFNLELVVDTFSAAWLGHHMSDEEDSRALVAAFEDAVRTAGAKPLAMLLDNLPANHTEDVDQALGDTLRTRATPFRPQHKCHVEGAFGLLEQGLPPLQLATHDPKLLALTVAFLVVVAYGRGLNLRSMRKRGGKSRRERHDEPVTEERLQRAKDELGARHRKQEAARLTRAARIDPRLRAFLDCAFETLGLLDPERHVRDAIAPYHRDAIADGIAIFRGKQSAGTLPDGADARYLLGIVRNLHATLESTEITEALITTRIAARDIYLHPLFRERDLILAEAENKDALQTLTDRAAAAGTTIERFFWIDAIISNLSQRPYSERKALFRSTARRVHASFRIPREHRETITLSLARRLWPLA